MMSGLPPGFDICCLRFTSGVTATHARLASGWRAAAFAGRESNPLERYERFQVIAILLSRTSPGASWIHAERLINRLITVTDAQRAAVALVRLLIWWLYHDLKIYRTSPSAQAKVSLKARFDRVFDRITGFAALDDALARLKERKSELLVVLDRPEVPLNTNSSEQDVRDPVTIRKISAGTRSEDGRRCRDTFLSLKKTCQKNAISFWAYLGDRLGIAANTVACLPDLIRRRATPAHA